MSDATRATLAALLPPGCAVVEARGELPGAALTDEEEAILGVVAPRRRHDFTVGRSCARRALAALGQPPASILRGAERQPLWPPGFVGSITHCDGYCAAAVAPRRQLAAIGIDAEPHAPLPSGVRDRVVFDDELDLVERPPDPSLCWDRILFSCKESIYKAWFEVRASWLGFDDVLVTLDVAGGRFRARPRAAGALASSETLLAAIGGRFAVGDGFIFSAAVVAAQPPDAPHARVADVVRA